MRIALTTLAFAAALAAQPQGWKELAGQDAPAFEAKEWLNKGEAEPDRDMLLGKVWLLFFFTPDFEPCMDMAESLSSLHDKFFDVGLRVVALSSAPVATLRKELIDSRKAKFWVGSDPLDVSLGRYATSPKVTVPHVFVVGGDGKVIGSELPSESDVRAMLEASHKVTQQLHAKLQKARVAYDAGSYGAAHKIASVSTKDADAMVAVDATLMCNKINGHAEFVRLTLAAEKVDDPNERYATLLRFVAQFDGLEPTKWAQTQLAELRKNDRVKPLLPDWS